MAPESTGSPQMRATLPSMRLPRRIFIGSVVSPKSLTEMTLIDLAVLGVGSSGVIRFVEDLSLKPGQERDDDDDDDEGDETEKDERSSTPVPAAASTSMLPPPALSSTSLSTSTTAPLGARFEKRIRSIVRRHGWRYEECDVVRLEPGSFLCPGFVDTHTHACQVPNMGTGQQYELLDWLHNITFPRERKFEDTRYAKRVYESVVQRMLDCGTTCAAIYATLHLEASKVLADICNERGLRALVGRCSMDRHAPPDYVEKNASVSMESSKDFIRYCRNLRPYGQAPDGVSPMLSPLESSGSPEMDASIARLTATMNEMRATRGGSDKGASRGGSEKGASRPGSPSTERKTLAPVGGGKGDVTAEAYHAQRHGSVGSQNSIGRYSITAGAATPSASGSPGIGSPPSAVARRDRELANMLVQPILTPRFAISCSDALLSGISALISRDPSLRIQTHISENEGEIRFTKELFPFANDYTGVYDHFSLLTPRTILAHAIHLSSSEMDLIQRRGCGVSHCPNSNLNLRSGSARVGEMLNRGIKVGLGTDVSGGFGLSMLTAVREASVVAKVLNFRRFEEDEGKEREVEAPEKGEEDATPAKKDFTKGPMAIPTLFYLATQGGADVCSLGSRIGSLEPGKEFDALHVRMQSGFDPVRGYAGNPNCFVNEDDSLSDRVEKFLFTGDDRNLAAVYVRGRPVGGTDVTLRVPV